MARNVSAIYASKSDVLKAFRAQAGGGTPVAALASPLLVTIVDEAWQPQLTRSAHLFGAIHRGSLHGDSGERDSTPDRPNLSCLMHSQEGARDTHDVCFAVEQIVESMRVATLHRLAPSWLTASISESRRRCPGEEQRAPFFDLSMHRGSWVDADGRVGARLAWAGGHLR